MSPALKNYRFNLRAFSSLVGLKEMQASLDGRSLLTLMVVGVLMAVEHFPERIILKLIDPRHI